MSVERSEIEEFIYREARLGDEHRYDAWLALWAEDGVYWVPCNGSGTDPTREVSFIYDDRARLQYRIERLKSGLAYTQKPKSLLRRVISNLEIDYGASGGIEARSNFILVELRRHQQNLWTGTTLHRLRQEDGGLKVVMKKVVLLNNDEEVPPMGFLI